MGKSNKPIMIEQHPIIDLLKTDINDIRYHNKNTRLIAQNILLLQCMHAQRIYHL